MEKEKDSQCPNCAELWERIDKLAEEKSQAQKRQAALLVLNILLFALILAGFVVRLLTL